MRISDWSSDVCSSDLSPQHQVQEGAADQGGEAHQQRDGDAVPHLEAVGRDVGAQHGPDGGVRIGTAIARPSCRERACPYVYISWAAVAFNKKSILLFH